MDRPLPVFHYVKQLQQHCIDTVCSALTYFLLLTTEYGDAVQRSASVGLKPYIKVQSVMWNFIWQI